MIGVEGVMIGLVTEIERGRGIGGTRVEVGIEILVDIEAAAGVGVGAGIDIVIGGLIVSVGAASGIIIAEERKMDTSGRGSGLQKKEKCKGKEIFLDCIAPPGQP